MSDEAKTKEYPRWVTPHESHVVRAGSVSVPDFGQSHVLRDGAVQVLVENEDEEKRATEAKVAPSIIEPPADGAGVSLDAGKSDGKNDPAPIRKSKTEKGEQ